jgi:hypothetical protein
VTAEGKPSSEFDRRKNKVKQAKCLRRPNSQVPCFSGFAGGPGIAAELIQGFAIAKTLETTEVDLIRTIFPHPTLSEIIHESVLGAYGRAIHV